MTDYYKCEGFKLFSFQKNATQWWNRRGAGCARDEISSARRWIAKRNNNTDKCAACHSTLCRANLWIILWIFCPLGISRSSASNSLNRFIIIYYVCNVHACIRAFILSFLWHTRCARHTHFYKVFWLNRVYVALRNHFENTLSFDGLHDGTHVAGRTHKKKRSLHLQPFASITSDMNGWHHVSRRRSGTTFLWREINVQRKFIGLAVAKNVHFDIAAAALASCAIFNLPRQIDIRQCEWEFANKYFRLINFYSHFNLPH